VKQYLYIAVVLVCVSADASQNPFALRENFTKIEQDQKTLLSKLREIAQKNEEASFTQKSKADEKKNDHPALSPKRSEGKESTSLDTLIAPKKKVEVLKVDKEVSQKGVSPVKVVQEKEVNATLKKVETEKSVTQKSEKEPHLKKLEQKKKATDKKGLKEKRESIDKVATEPTMIPKEIEIQRLFEEAVKEVDQED